MYKKRFKLMALCLVAVMAMAMLAGCGGGGATTAPTTSPTTAVGGTNDPNAGSAGDKTLKIGFITGLTGVWAANGNAMVNGLKMYLEEKNNVLAGYNVEVFIEDDEGVVETGLNKARKLVEKDNVDILYGVMAANIGYAVAEYGVSQKIPVFLPCVAAEDLTQRKADPYIIRTGWTSAQPMHPFGEWAYEQGFRRVACMSFDYAFGHETVAGFRRTFEAAGGEITNTLWPASGTTDYMPFLTQIPRDVDAIFVNFNGADSGRVLKQIRELGYTQPILGGSTTVDEHILPQLGNEALDVYSALQWCANIDRPATKDFVDKYKEIYKTTPSYYAMESYGGLAFLEAGLEGAGGLSDVVAFGNAIKKANVVAVKSDITIDEYNNPIQDIYIRQVKMVDGEMKNELVKVYSKVSQFWTYGADKYLSKPVYGRDFKLSDYQ